MRAPYGRAANQNAANLSYAPTAAVVNSGLSMTQRPPVTAESVLERARAELRNARFSNWHGITPQNVLRFLLETPVEREVLTPESATSCTMMSLVLHEYPNDPCRGYTIALNPVEDEWILVECLSDGSWFCDTVGGATLPEALESM